MTDPKDRATPEPLQFDRAVEADAAPAGAQSAQALTCASCGQPITTSYYDLNGQSVCATCKENIERAVVARRSGGALLRSAIFGLGAAVAGAAIYYGVIALLNLEIGIVAILIGYMVGAAVRKGAAGGGGRRFQILAVALTYFSVGLAYSPLAFKGFATARMEKVVSADSTAPRRTTPQIATDRAPRISADSAPDISTAPPVRVKQLGGGAILLALGATFLFIFVLPVLAVAGSMPSGIISAIIIGVGLRQAWRMTAGHVFTITGPYKVGGGPAGPAAPTPSSA